MTADTVNVGRCACGGYGVLRCHQTLDEVEEPHRLRDALERIASAVLVVDGRCGFCQAPKPVGRYDAPWHREHCVFAIARAAIAAPEVEP